MDRDAYQHGEPSWVDLGTPDPAKAAEFYSTLFGWDVQVGPPEAGGYAICHVRGRPVAGLGPQMNPGPPHWASYVNVDDAEEVAVKVVDNGGKMLMEPFDVMTAGRMAMFSDPAGAALSVWQAGDLEGAGVVAEPGTYCWSELVTTDVPGAIAFYPAVFGWTTESHGPPGAGGYTECKLGGRPIAGMMPMPGGMPADVLPHWMVYFAVADADAAVATVDRLGGRTMLPPQDIEPGRFAVVADPTGAVFSVLHLRMPPRA